MNLSIYLFRDEDMLITGFRHPFLGRYKVGFSKEGKILGVDASLYANAGKNLVIFQRNPKQMESFSLYIHIFSRS